MAISCQPHDSFSPRTSTAITAKEKQPHSIHK